MYYQKNVCAFSKEIRQSREQQDGGCGGKSNNLHTVSHIHKHTRLPNKSAPLRERKWSGSQASHMNREETPAVYLYQENTATTRPQHTHLNSTRIWHCTSSQRHMIYFQRPVFTHLSVSFCSFKEKPIFHTNMLSWVFWSCDFRQCDSLNDWTLNQLSHKRCIQRAG